MDFPIESGKKQSQDYVAVCTCTETPFPTWVPTYTGDLREWVNRSVKAQQVLSSPP